MEDTGDLIYAPTDADYCIRKSNSPAKPLRFKVGDRVLCHRDAGWMSGTVVKTNYLEEDLDGSLVPYQVKLDGGGDLVYAPMDHDESIRKERAPLRFAVGDRVECFVEDTDTEGWFPGTVTKTYHTDFNGEELPYKIELDGVGFSVFAPVDEDCCIRECATHSLCRGEVNGCVHAIVKMLVKKEEYEEASRILQGRIVSLRSTIEESDDTAHLAVDLSYFLLHLVDLYEARGMLDEMKEALDEVTALIVASDDKYKPRRLLNARMKQAMHAALSSDKFTALKYSEEAVLLLREMSPHSARLGGMLFRTGKLNARCNNRERGMSQMSEGVEMLTSLYGCEDPNVQRAMKDYVLMIDPEKADGVGGIGKGNSGAVPS